MTIGDRVRELRKAKNLTQDELANAISGLTRRMVAGIEIGDTNPTLKQIEAFSMFFNVSADYLIFGIDTPNKDEIELINTIKEDKGLYQSLTTLINAKKNINAYCIPSSGKSVSVNSINCSK